MERRFDKHFTLEQANALIPHVRKLFAEVRALLKPPSAEASPLQANFPGIGGNGHGPHCSNGNGNGNGTHPPAAGGPEEPVTSSADYSGWSEEKRHEAAYRLLNALLSQGIVIQDVMRGLIDFPSVRNGREVFLCYELSDGSSIHYFHEIEAGYAGRKSLTETDD